MVDNSAVVCEVVKEPLEDHMIKVLEHGQVILDNGGSSVIVSATVLSDTFDGACK